MFFIKLSNLRKDNKLLHRKLHIEEGAVVDLQFDDGVYVCPDDVINEESHIPRIILTERTIVDIYRYRAKKLFEDVVAFYRTSGVTFPLRNYEKFKHGLKLAYLFAAAYYVHSKAEDLSIRSIKKVSKLLVDPHKSNIEKNLQKYLSEFIELAVSKQVKISYYSLFPFAVMTIKQACPNAFVPRPFSSLNSFLRSPQFNAYTLFVGEEFEEELQEVFEKIEGKHEIDLAAHLLHYFKTPGVLIPLEMDPQFKKIAKKREAMQKVRVPDYLFVTQNLIRPVDLKVNLKFTKPDQISGSNLRKLFAAMPDIMAVIFEGISIEGKVIEPVEEETKIEAAWKSAKTPMQAFGKMKSDAISRKDIKKIVQLWKIGKPISQKKLSEMGIKGNLALIVEVFNGILKNKK